MKRPLFAALSVLICTGVSAAQPVTPQNFTRAETDRYFADIQQKAAAQAGHGSGINQFFYIRTIPKAGDRTIVRMNNDTLYGGVVVDTRGGATLTIPKMPDGRYASALILDNDHYAPEVFYTSGMHKLPERTRYLMVAIRIQVFDPKDEAEIKMVNGLQDKFKVNAHSSVPFKSPGWDQNQLNMQRKAFEEQFSRFQRYPDDWQGPRGKVNEKTRAYAAAGAWGLFPNKDATYINYNAHLPANKCYTATYQVPPNKAFWSITVYDKEGFTDSANSFLNRSNTRLNSDGTFTAYFGSEQACGNKQNRVDIPDGWNFLMRIYRPGKSVLTGEYKLPDVMEVKL